MMSNPFDRVTLPSSVQKAVKKLCELSPEELDKLKAAIDRAIVESADTAAKNALTALGSVVTSIMKV